METATVPTAQERFDQQYITSTEIAQIMKVPRATILYARSRGMLPHAVAINNGQIYIWEREPLKPYLDAWKVSLASRRGELV